MAHRALFPLVVRSWWLLLLSLHLCHQKDRPLPVHSQCWITLLMALHHQLHYCQSIDRYLDELRHRAGCKEQVKLSRVERLIHNCKYYLDGTPKKGPNSPKEDQKLNLVQALLHQYNEDHNLFGTHAHELEALVGHEWIYHDHR